jgi:hypothetical protein
MGFGLKIKDEYFAEYSENADNIHALLGLAKYH